MLCQILRSAWHVSRSENTDSNSTVFQLYKTCLASIQICEQYTYSKFRSDAQRFDEMFMFATVDRLQKGDKRYFLLKAMPHGFVKNSFFSNEPNFTPLLHISKVINLAVFLKRNVHIHCKIWKLCKSFRTRDPSEASISQWNCEYRSRAFCVEIFLASSTSERRTIVNGYEVID